MKFGRRARFWLMYPLMGISALYAHTSEMGFRIGVPIIALGGLLRLWANGYHHESKVLTTGGPYAHLRHPLYLGSLLIGVGFLCVFGRLWLTVGAVAFYLIFYSRTIRQEEATLRLWLGAQYDDYAQHVKRFLPRWTPYPHRSGSAFQWRRVMESGELKTVMWVIVLLLAFYLREELFQEHERLGFKGGLVIGIMATLMVCDGLLELLQRLMRKQVAVA